MPWNLGDPTTPYRPDIAMVDYDQRQADLDYQRKVNNSQRLWGYILIWTGTFLFVLGMVAIWSAFFINIRGY